MGDTTGVNWTGATWNPIQGCRKVSVGCKYCYMFRDKERYGQDPTKVHRSSKATFDKPLKWQREAERGDRVGHDCLVFTCSWSDWFIEEADGAWRDDMWAITKACSLLTFQILTKRPERMRQMLTSPRWAAMKPLPNVWLGVSVEDQMTADERIPLLLDTPAAIRWISAEPLLGPLDLDRIEAVCSTWRKGLTIGTYLDWVVVGGESGPGARPFHLNWAHDLIDQCRAAGVPVFVKQVGARPVIDRDDSRIIRDRKGGDMSEWPSSIRIREFPRPVAVPA